MVDEKLFCQKDMEWDEAKDRELDRLITGPTRKKDGAFVSSF